MYRKPSARKSSVGVVHVLQGKRLVQKKKKLRQPPQFSPSKAIKP
jgi:hypothetical protein